MTGIAEKVSESSSRELGQCCRWQVFAGPALDVTRPRLDQAHGVTPPGQSNGGGDSRGSRANDEGVSAHEP